MPDPEQCRLAECRSLLDDSRYAPFDCPIPSCDACPSLAKLDAEILLAHNHLVELSKKRLSLKRLINERHDPLRRLPTEMLSEIFKFYCMPDARFFSSNTPLVIGAVCKHWRDVTLGTPQLWRTIKIHADFYKPYDVEVAAEWLSRSRSIPLSLEIKFSGPDDGIDLENNPLSPLIHLLRAYSARWENVTIEAYCQQSFLRPLFNNLESLPSDFDCLSIDISADPMNKCNMDRLLLPKTLCIEGDNILGLPLGWDRLTSLLIFGTFDFDEIFCILKNAPNLARCNISADLLLADMNASDVSDAPIIIKPLTVLHGASTSAGAENILDYLTLPFLESFQYDYQWRSAEDNDFGRLQDFLDRSSPRLETLSILVMPTGSSRSLDFRFTDLPTETTMLTFEANGPGMSNGTVEVTRNFLSLLVGSLNDGGLPKLQRLLLDYIPTTPEFWSALANVFPPPDQPKTGRENSSKEVESVKQIPSGFKSLKTVNVWVQPWWGTKAPMDSIDPSVFSRLVEIENSGVKIMVNRGNSKFPVSKALNREF